jgi:diguanylate cyclase (GGDEF)-like protein/PAS domain S-box-containing protein
MIIEHMPQSDALTFPTIRDFPGLLEICIDRLNDAIVITEAEPINNPGPRIIWANQVFYRRNGYSPEEVLGQSPRFLQGPDTDRATLDRIRTALETWQSVRAETLNYRKDGTTYWNELEIVPIANEKGWFTHWVSVQRDVTVRKALEQQVQQLAFYDPLTGLPNRRLLDDRLALALASSRRRGLDGALMFLDLDNFKALNDRHGHGVGDLLLIEVAKRLRNCVREVDTVARLGGDEFVVILCELDANLAQSADNAHRVAEKIRASLAAPYLLTIEPTGQLNATLEHHCSASIGIVMLTNNQASQSEVMQWADAAMYQAKDGGRNRVHLYAHNSHSLQCSYPQREQTLQEREAFKSVILNSLEAEIAVVDRNGVILAVNDRWQQFALDNGLEPGKPAPNTGVGSNYFAVCVPGSADGAGDMLDARAGLQAVLDGRLARFNLDYPCDSPTQARWFARTVMPLGQGVRDGAVITHTDITQRKQAEEQLRLAARVFSNAHEGITITNAENIIIEVNEAFSRITGYSREEALGQNPRFLQSGRQDKAFYEAMWRSLTEQGHWAGELWNRHKSGKVIAEHLSISAMRDADGSLVQYVGHFTDISDRIKAQAEIDTLAFYDPLTQLPNRRLLLNRLDQALHVSTRHARNNALLFVDLDNFKILNDTQGHIQGDLLLVQVTQRLRACIRDGDTLARLGSDEFVVMLENLSDDVIEAATQAEAVGVKILGSFVADFALNSGSYHGTPSIGITLFGGPALESNEQPLKRAELAMFQAKAAGRNMLRFFDAQMQAEVSAHALMTADLREAVIKQQFVLYYQPQVVGGGRITGVEALVRWRHPQRGIVSPAEFIPLAEETGLILPLGQWVLDTACLQLAAWAKNPALAHLTVAVNVSACQFQRSDFVGSVLATLERTGATPKLLKLEMTESMLVDDMEAIITKMGVLKAQGVTFSLDDFGTGYSSLAHLKRLPLHQLKIDQGFVQNIVTDPNDAVIAKMVVVLAESMGLSVIAEGVELQAQADCLAQLGCHAYQGYWFSRPLGLAALEALVLGG